MNISIEQAQGFVPVTILSTHGDLDGSNYQIFIEKARQAVESGARNILIDLSDTPFISSAGLIALHATTLLLRGEQPPSSDAGWEALHAIDRDLDSGIQPHVKLLNPQPRVIRTLEKTGLDHFLEIYTDRETALASFK
jgi:anti-anti-sigma regulatory factor